MKVCKIFLVSAVLLLFASCRHREVVYLSDAQRDTAQAIMDVYTATIMPGDQLYIHVSSMVPESVLPFNQETHTIVFEGNTWENIGESQSGVIDQAKEQTDKVSNSYKSSEVTGYFVSERGTIDFPILGPLTVVGLTQDSLCRYIENRLKDEGYVNDPQVTMNLMNFRVTVVGEVRSPKQIHVQGTRLTILEAIAICGDLTDYGMRENLTIVRSENGKQEIGEIDLTKKEMLDSPYYYLHNNDIVYVEPNNRRKRASDRDPNVPRYISIGVSVWSIIRTQIRISQVKD